VVKGIMRNIYKKVIYLVLIVCFGWLGHGCNIVNPPEQVPTYIHIDSFHFIRNPKFYDITGSHQVTTVWVYYNNNPIGTFDLPCTIPIVMNGDAKGTVQMAPGILVNGMNSTVPAYPFYTIDTFQFNANPGKIINHTPVTQFSSGAKITKLSYFEGTVDFLPLDGTLPITNVSDDSLVFEGLKSGSILLASSSDSAIDGSAIPFPIPFSQRAFIEFDYKTDIPFYVGLQANEGTISSTPYFLAGINPSSTWKKFYMDAEDFVAHYQGTGYNFFIKASLPADKGRGRVLLDNIQLVTF
jgi:hypothetical protein